VFNAYTALDEVGERKKGKALLTRGTFKAFGVLTTDVHTPLSYLTTPIIMFTADQARKPGHKNVLLITTGSVASIKAPLIVKELLKVTVSFGCERDSSCAV